MLERCRFGLFEFDRRTGELRREGDIVKLSPQPARLLALLLATPGEIVLREELRAHLWGEETFVDFERGLNFCVLQVRAALGDSSDNPRFIQTVPRKGYRFIAPVTTSVPASDVRSAEAPSSASATSVPVSDRPPAHRVWQSRRVATVTVGALVVLAALNWLLLEYLRPPRAADPSRVRVAVLPFTSLTGDSADDYVADGLTDELIAQLGRVSPARLAVIARTSVAGYRNATKRVADIGRELNVQYVVEGSVRRDGSRMRVTTELIDVSDEAQVWSDAFERVTGDSMDLQTAVAVRVARALTLELIPGVIGPALPRPTANAEAWDAYLRGRYFLDRGGTQDVRQSLEQFETAVRLDPSFACSWAKLAEARHVMVMIGAMAPRDAYPRAEEAAKRALEIDSTLADAHVANGLVALWYNWRPSDAARHFERALAVNPSHAFAHHDYAWSLVALGRFDEAVEHITAARDLDPLSPRANTDIGWLYLHLRRPAEAVRACQHTLAIQPQAAEAQACLERAYIQLDRWDEALRAAEATLPKDASLLVHGTAEAPTRVHAIWRWRLTQMQQAESEGWVNPYTIAVHRAFVADHHRAMAQLEQAYAARAGMLVFIKTDPALDPLRVSAQFDALVDKVRASSR